MLPLILHAAFDRQQTSHLISRWAPTRRQGNVFPTSYVLARLALKKEETFSVAQMRGDTLSCFVMKDCGWYHEVIVALTDEKRDFEGVLSDFQDWYKGMPTPLLE